MMVLAIALPLLINVSLARSVIERLAAERYVAKQQAFHVAEAGLDEVFWQLQNASGGFDGWVLITDNDVADPSYAQCAEIGFPCRRRDPDLNLGIGSAQIIVGNVGSALPTVLLSSQVRDLREALRIEAGLALGLPVNFPWAIAAGADNGTGIKLSQLQSGTTLPQQYHNVILDDYDSRLEDYSFANRTNILDPSTFHADIRANSNDTTSGQQAIVLDPTSEVYGDAIAGPDHPVSLTIPVPPKGSPLSSPAVTLPLVTLPPGSVTAPPAYLTCPSGGISVTVDAFNATFAGIDSTTPGEEPCDITIIGNGVVQMDQLSVMGFYSSIVLDGNITVVVHGNVVLNEGTHIGLGNHTASHTSAELYVNGNVSFGLGNYGVGVNENGHDQVTSNLVVHNPLDFRVYVQGERTVLIRQGSLIRSVIYAPQSNIEVATGNNNSQVTTIFGSLVGNRVTIGNPNNWGDIIFHYDRALNPDNGVNLIPSVSLRVWRYRRM